MFRRFGIIKDDGTEDERLINLNCIAVIGIDSQNRTFIRVVPGLGAAYFDYISSVEYKHLADVLDLNPFN